MYHVHFVLISILQNASSSEDVKDEVQKENDTKETVINEDAVAKAVRENACESKEEESESTTLTKERTSSDPVEAESELTMRVSTCISNSRRLMIFISMLHKSMYLINSSYCKLQLLNSYSYICTENYYKGYCSEEV